MDMINKRKEMKVLLIGILFLVIIFGSVGVVVGQQRFEGATTPSFSGPTSSGSYSSVRAQTYSPYASAGFDTQYQNYAPILFNSKQCEVGQDFLIQIAPFGCSPSVVRSDILEEQNVPVFCQLNAFKINPLIDVEAIDSISFRGQTPEAIAGVGFHPARAALKTDRKLSGSAILNNIGYVVLVLRQEPVEAKQPDFVSGNLTALIRYDIQNAFGIGQRDFTLPELSEQEWRENFAKYGFWQGRAFIRAENIDTTSNSADVALYSDENIVLSSATLQKGKPVSVPIPGLYCRAHMDMVLEEIKGVDTTATLRIDDDVLDLESNQRFLNNKCQVVNIESSGLSQKVEVRCPQGQKDILEFSPKIKLIIKDSNGVILADGDFAVGDIVYNAVQNNKGDKNIFLGYVSQDTAGNPFVILVISSAGNSELFKTTQIFKRLGQLDFIRQAETGVGIADALKGALGLAAKYGRDLITNIFGGACVAEPLLEGESKTVEGLTRIFCEGFTKGTIEGIQVSFIGFSGPIDRDYSKITSGEDATLGQRFEENFLNSIQTYEQLAQLYPQEYRDNERDDNLNPIAAEGLIEAQKFAKDSNKFITRLKLIDELLERYPNSPNAAELRRERNSLLSSNAGELSTIMEVDGKLHTISLESVNKPKFNDYGVNVVVNSPNAQYGGSFNMVKGQIIPLSSESETLEFVEIVDQDSAKFRATVKKKGPVTIEFGSTTSFTLNLREAKNFEGTGIFGVTLSQVNYKPVAKVRLTPKIDNTFTEANISFRVDIEKRAIQLAPEKIQNKIDNLDEKIAKWSNISDGLGKINKGLKTACLGTGAVLTVKNFFANTKGQAFSRQTVMQSKGGWNEICRDALQGKGLKGSEGYKSLDECFFKNSDEINKDVNSLQNIIKQQNEELKALDDANSETGFLGEKIVNDNDFVDDFFGKYGSEIQGLSVSDCLDLDLNTAKNALSAENKDKNYYTIDDLRSIQRSSRVLNSEASDTLKNIEKQNLCDELLDVQNFAKQNAEIESLQQGLANNGFGNQIVDSYGDEESVQGFYRGGIGNIPNVVKDVPIQAVRYNGKGYMLVLGLSAGNSYYIKEIYNLNNNGSLGTKIGNETQEHKDVQKFFGKGFKKFDRTSYENKYLKAEARYYETEPYKGLPAVVPFDLNNGWYAATKQTLPVFGSIRAFDDSGRVSSFRLCNVGENGLEEFEKLGDDNCEVINIGIGQPYDSFPGLTASEAKSLISDAIKAIQQAADQHKEGVKTISISTSKGRFTIPVGKAQVNIPGTQCTDFMSPSDCKLLFNVCDPVICPSSRCNLGGSYYVNDVIQSGIIGSIALCAPNYRQGIAVPVCLTGIQAGVDGLVSIFQSGRDCLQEQLDSGRTVGICDEIQSIYMCELLWREALPIANVAIPKLVEFAAGQNVRGGGEYLGVQSAWDNAQGSVSYLTDIYGANAKKAFNLRSTQDAGGAICKTFVSAKYANGADLLDSLTEPDSPNQFHAWFNEIPFSSVTVPPTSQYKVFFHIYAGKDIGSFYQVFLKSPSGITGFQEVPQIIVDSGYIPVGSFASETRDFTAPSGYQELCINVNGQVECGFDKVSTSFALNYLRDNYLAEQAERTDIKTEKECISGQASLFSLVQPNIQEGIADVASPRLYDQGIVRVCSTDNPGLSTDPNSGNPQTSRWVEVGYCDQRVLKCWADKESIARQIKSTTIENETLSKLTEDYINKAFGDGYLLSESDAKEKIKSFGESLSKKETQVTEANLQQRIKELDDMSNRLILNYQKAEVLLLKARVYKEVAMQLFKQVQSNLPKLPATQEKAVDEAIEVAGGSNVLSVKRDANGSVKVTSETQGEGPVGLMKQDIIDEGGNIKTVFVSPEFISGVENKIIFRFIGESRSVGEWQYRGLGSSEDSFKSVTSSDFSVKEISVPTTFPSSLPLQYHDRTLTGGEKQLVENFKSKSYNQGVEFIVNDVISRQSHLSIYFPDGTNFDYDWSEGDKLTSLLQSITLQKREDITLSIPIEATCDSCGDGAFNVCDRDECLGIGVLLGGTCRFDDQSALVPGGTCVSTTLSPGQAPEDGILDCSNIQSSGGELSVRYAGCISASKIDSILSNRNSPATGFGSSFVSFGQQYNIDPIIALAFFNQESSLGIAGVAVQTGSIGNIKYSSNCPGEKYIDSLGREWCKYNSWSQSIEHWYQLIFSSTYISSGKDTVEKIIPIYAPSSDNNDEEAYIRNVRNFVINNREVTTITPTPQPVPTPTPSPTPILEPDSGVNPTIEGFVFTVDGTRITNQVRKDQTLTVQIEHSCNFIESSVLRQDFFFDNSFGSFMENQKTIGLNVFNSGEKFYINTKCFDSNGNVVETKKSQIITVQPALAGVE
jgi:hypothetical protein